MIKVFVDVLTAGLDQHDFYVLWEVLGQSLGIAERWEVLLQHAAGLFYGGLFLLSGHSSLHLVEVRACLPPYIELKSSVGRKMATVHFTTISCKACSTHKVQRKPHFCNIWSCAYECLRYSGCLPFVRINRLGWPLNKGNGFTKISKPTERDGATVYNSISRNYFKVTRDWKSESFPNSKKMSARSVPNGKRRLLLVVVYDLRTDTSGNYCSVWLPTKISGLFVLIVC